MPSERSNSVQKILSSPDFELFKNNLKFCTVSYLIFSKLIFETVEAFKNLNIKKIKKK